MRLLTTIGVSDRHAASPFDPRDSDRQPVTIGDSERHIATPWHRRDSDRQPETNGDSERQAAKPGKSKRHAPTSRD